MTDKYRKFTSRREFLRLSAIVAAGTTFAACAPPTAQPEQASAPESAPAAEEDTTITLWSWGTSMFRYLAEDGSNILAEKVKEDLGLDLETTPVEHADMAAKLKAALPAGTGPDMVNTDFDVMGPFWGFMEPLNAWGEKEWGSSWKTDLLSGPALSEMELVSSTLVGTPGEAYHMPGNMQLLGWLYYWIPVFEERGIDPSTLNTWEDFEDMLQSFLDDGIRPLGGQGHPAAYADWFKSLVEVTAPGKMAEVQLGQGDSKFTDPDMVAAFDLFAKVYSEYMQEGALAAADGNLVREGFWNGGSLPMLSLFTGTPYFSFTKNENEVIRNAMHNDVGTFLIPGSKGLAGTDAGVAMVAESDNKENAWEYMKWRTLGPGGEQMARTGQPVAAKAIAVPLQNTDFDKNLGAPLLEALASGDNVFRRILCTDVYQAATTTLPGVTEGLITAEQAAQEVQDAFDANCDQWMG